MIGQGLKNRFYTLLANLTVYRSEIAKSTLFLAVFEAQRTLEPQKNKYPIVEGGMILNHAPSARRRGGFFSRLL